MEQFVQNVLTWVAENPHWAGLVVLGIAFFESLAIVGLAVPGWLLLLGIGSLIGAGSLNFWIIALFSFAGAALGQLVSYAVGYYFQDRVHQWPWVKRHEKLFHQSETFFNKHGFAGILIGQFIGPIRAVISLMAGILDMPPKKFILAILIAAAIWAPLYLIPGTLIGAAMTFERQDMWIAIGLMLGLLVPAWLLIRFFVDWRRAKKVNESLMTRRKVVAMAMVLLLLTTIYVITATRYGIIMSQLTHKIWQVIS